MAKAQAIHDEPNTLWADRRTHTGHETAVALAGKLHPDNAYDHPDDQNEAVDESLDSLGWVAAVSVNETTGRIFDGHLRVKLALLKDPSAQIPVDYYNLTEEEEALALQVVNATTQMAQPNADKLAALMERTRGMVADRPALRGMLEELKARAGVNGKELVREVEPQIDKAAELQEKWGTALGQVWELGRHRLIVGDSADKEVVAAVAFGDRIDFIFMDPPYSVSYADKNRSLNAVAKGNSIQTPIEGDHLNTEETAKRIWGPAFRNLFELAKLGCVYYCTAPQGGDQMMMMMTLHESGWLVKHELIWLKNNLVLGRADYQYKHEPIIYGWRPGAAHYFIDSRSEVSVWEITKPLKSDLHPTTKPLELVERAMKNSCKRGDICVDTFVGSGTTLIAAERLGRVARCADIDPNYCAVTLQRYYDLTNDAPRLVAEAT